MKLSLQATSYKLQGFTLIELLVVIAIISLLSSIILASLNTARAKARDSKIIQDMLQIKNALELYHSKYGKYPTAEQPSGYAVVPPFNLVKKNCWECPDDSFYILNKLSVLETEGLLKPLPSSPGVPPSLCPCQG